MVTKRQHLQQHKDESEEKKKTRAMVELKRENQKLRRKLSRTEKQLIKNISTMDKESDEPEPPLDSLPPKMECPECKGHDMVVMNTPTGTLTGCKDCSWKTHVKH